MCPVGKTDLTSHLIEEGTQDHHAKNTDESFAYRDPWRDPVSGKLLPPSLGNLGDRINQALTALGQDKSVQITRRSWKTLQRYAASSTEVPAFVLVELAVALGWSITWMATGEGPRDSRDDSSHTMRTQQEQKGVPVLHVQAADLVPTTGFISVPMLDVRASAGQGIIAHGEEVTAYLAMEAAFLRSLGISPACARIVDVSGDSMYPTLRDRDRIVVDTSIEHIADEGLYAVLLGGALLIKRVQIGLDGGITLRSDNRTAGYEDISVPVEDLDDLRIVGRVRIRIHLM